MYKVQQPPFETFKNPTCRGSILLGSACGKCERCEWERKQMTENKVPASASPTPPVAVDARNAWFLEQAADFRIRAKEDHNFPGEQHLVADLLVKAAWLEEAAKPAPAQVDAEALLEVALGAYGGGQKNGREAIAHTVRMRSVIRELSPHLTIKPQADGWQPIENWDCCEDALFGWESGYGCAYEKGRVGAGIRYKDGVWNDEDREIAIPPTHYMPTGAINPPLYKPQPPRLSAADVGKVREALNACLGAMYALSSVSADRAKEMARNALATLDSMEGA